MAIKARRLSLFASCIVVAALPGGCRMRKPGALETRVAQFVKRDVTIGGADDRNPLKATADNLVRGQHEFIRSCAMCHGLDGRGTGVPFADNMSPPVPPLSAHGVQEYRDGQLHWIIRNGIYPSGMPAWAGVLTDGQIWRMVLYIRHLPAAGSLGVPGYYATTRHNGFKPQPF